MMITMYGIKNCDSVKKAKKFFDANNITYTFIDFKSEPATCVEVDAWLKHVSIDTLFNARSTTYRTLRLSTQSLNADDKRMWLCKENLLIKRPVVVTDNKVLVGFNQSTYEGEFGNGSAT